MQVTFCRGTFVCVTSGIINVLVLLSLCLGAADAQSVTTQPEKWREDLRFLARELPQRHPNPFAQISSNDFQFVVNQLDAAIPTLPDHVIQAQLVGLVALLHDAHTSLDFTSGAMPFRRYPIAFRVFMEDLYVVAVTSEPGVSERGRVNYARALGARVVRIGQTDIVAAGIKVSALVSAENLAWLKQRIGSFLVTPEILHALDLLPDMERGRFVFADADGREFEMTFKPVARNAAIPWVFARPSRVPTPLYRSRPATTFYWYQHLPENRTVYFQYNRCTEMASQPFAAFSDELIAFIDSNNVERVIVDLRQNPGGNSGILQRFLTSIRLRSRINRNGGLYVLIDNGTFSSGLLNALDFRFQTQATFVGEPTGGKPNHFGEVRTFTLPNSQMTVQHSTRLFRLVAGDPESFFPDVTVELSGEDYFNGRDPVLEWVLAN